MCIHQRPDLTDGAVMTLLVPWQGYGAGDEADRNMDEMSHETIIQKNKVAEALTYRTG